MFDAESDDEEEFFYQAIPPTPLSKWVPIRFAVGLTMGVVRSVLIALDRLEDDFISAEGYERQKREFQDAVREELEALPTVEE